VLALSALRRRRTSRGQRARHADAQAAGESWRRGHLASLRLRASASPQKARRAALVARAMGQGAHAGSPGDLVAPHQGHPRPHPVHKLKVENASLHPKVRQPRRRPAPVPLRCDPDLHAYPPASPACFMCPFGCTTHHASTPQETALRGGDNAPARRCDLVHFEAVHGRCGGCPRTADSGGKQPVRSRAPTAKSRRSFSRQGHGPHTSADGGKRPVRFEALR